MKRLLISKIEFVNFYRDESRIWNNNFNEIFLSPSCNLISRLGNHFLSRILETFPPGRSKRSFQILMEGQPLDYFRFPYAVVCPGIEHDRAPEQKKYTNSSRWKFFHVDSQNQRFLFLSLKNLRDYAYFLIDSLLPILVLFKRKIRLRDKHTFFTV